MNDILNKILATKQEEVLAAKAHTSLTAVKQEAQDAPPARPFAQALSAKAQVADVALIAEIKKASPSKGLIRKDFDPVALAKAYERAGAACLSVLTDESYFQGNPGYLKAARAAVSLPVLRKDFIVDEYQIYQARSWGADAILLIAAALEQSQLQAFEVLAHELGMAVLLEIHDEAELNKCQALTTPLWGVNNRNLRTFEVDLAQTIRLAPQLAGKTIIAESGIQSPDDVRQLRSAGIHGFLIGEHFMRANDVEAAVKQLFA